MKRTLMFLVVIGGLALACGGSDNGTTSDKTVAPVVATTNPNLNARWNSLGLPVGDLTVIISDETLALMAYDGENDFATRDNQWKAAFAAAGWTVNDTYSETDFEAVIYDKGDAEVGFAIGADHAEGEPTAVLVYLEDLKKIPAEQSTVRQARTSHNRVTRKTRPRTLRNGNGTNGVATPRNLGTGGTTTTGGTTNGGTTRPLNRGH